MEYKKYVKLRDGSKELLELANVYDSISSDTIKKLLAEPDSNVVNPLLCAGWQDCSEELPKHGVNVLAYYKNEYGKNRIVRACYYERFKEESNCDEDSHDEYCEEKDNYYICDGWYECVDNWSDYLNCTITDGIVTHWMPLPYPPTGI